LADAYREAKQYEKAQTLYDQAIELAYERLQINGKDADTMGNLALYYAKKGGRSKGLELITSARSLDPKNIQLLYNEAVIQALNKNSDAALKSLAECLKSGFPKGVIMNEPDLASLRATPEFAALMRSNQ